MAFWATISLDRQARYQRWHNNEHIPERLALPGFVYGRRYRSVLDDARFLMYYETQDAGALSSPEYLNALDHPTARTQTALRWFEKPMRSVFELHADTAVAGERHTSASPVLAIARVAIEATGSDSDVALRVLAARLGARRIRHFLQDEATSRVSTREAQIHGADPGSRQQVLFIEAPELRWLDDPQAWAEASDVVAEWAQGQGATVAPQTDFYSLEFALGPTQ